MIKRKQHACTENSAAQTAILTYSMTDEGEAVSRSVHLIGFNDVLAKPSILLTGLMRAVRVDCAHKLFMNNWGKQIIRGPTIGFIEKMSTGCLTWAGQSAGMCCESERCWEWKWVLGQFRARKSQRSWGPKGQKTTCQSSEVYTASTQLD